MNLEVTKPFKTLTRKFAIGDKITEADVHDSQLTVGQLTERKFVKPVTPPRDAKPASAQTL